MAEHKRFQALYKAAADNHMVAIMQGDRIFLLRKEIYDASYDGEEYDSREHTNFPNTPDGMKSALLWLSADFSDFNADWE